jgi:histidinol-phosphate aminotransferase
MLRLDANEGRCLLSENDLREILSPEIARRYPVRGLLEGPLAERLGLPASCVLATAGADDAIDRAVRTLAGPGGLVMSTHPGFVEFLAAAQRSSAMYASISKDPFGPFPIREICEALREKRPQLLILSSPDNPSGGVLSPTGLAEIAAACGESGTIFIFDVTYGDFSPNTATPADAFAFSNVLVSGSFSKSRGLAGFRIGYMAGNTEMEGIIGRLGGGGPPFSLSSSAIEAGRRALSIDPDRVKAFVDEIRREVRELSALLKSMDFLVSESEANFVLIRADEAIPLAAALRRKEIFVRTWQGKPGYEDLVRITVPGEAGEFGELTEAIISVGKIMGINKEALA